MKKILFATVAFFSFKSLSSQSSRETARRQVDSISRVLPALQGSQKVDALNTLAYKIFDASTDTSYQSAIESSYQYALQANNEAKRLDYKKGLGYSFIRLGYCENQRADEYFNQNKKDNPEILRAADKDLDQAISIGKQLDDKLILGDAYWLKSLTGNTRINDSTYIEKALSYYTQSNEQLRHETYKSWGQAECPGCVGNERWIGGIYRDIARGYYSKDLSLSKTYIKKALPYFEKANDLNGIKSCYWHLYSFCAGLHEYDEAKNALNKVLSICQQSNDEEGEFQAYKELCALCWNIGDFENGFEAAKKAVLLTQKLAHQKTNFRFSLGQSLFWMSWFYKTGGDYQTALNVIQQARPFLNEGVTFKDTWAATIGDIYRLLGNYDSAFSYLKRFDTAGSDPTALGRKSLGRLYVDLKEYDKALTIINTVLSRNDLTNDPDGRGVTSTIAASAYFGKKEFPTALKFAREGLADLQRGYRRVRIMDSYELLSQIFHALNKDDSAYYYQSKFYLLKDSIVGRQFMWRLSNYEKEAEEQRKTSQLNLLNKENQLKESRLQQQATVRNSLIAGLVLLVLLGIFIFRNQGLKRRNERLRLQKEMELRELENEKKQAQLQRRSTELEMQALRAQMNPHFIFNCLSSINKFILKNESQAASDYLTRFSRLIRRVLTHSQLSLIPLSDEIEMLKLYLDMERLRFDNAFDYNVIYANAIEPETIYIPPVLLQPFCENAIWHGLMHKEGKGKLEIEMRVENEELHCTIADNGIGRAQAAALKSKSGEKRKSFGLKITQERLALFNNDKVSESFYHTDDVLDAEGNVAGTRVRLVIKCSHAVHEQINA